jgi:hypothetical protein
MSWNELQRVVEEGLKEEARRAQREEAAPHGRNHDIGVKDVHPAFERTHSFEPHRETVLRVGERGVQIRDDGRYDRSFAGARGLPRRASQAALRTTQAAADMHQACH